MQLTLAFLFLVLVSIDGVPLQLNIRDRNTQFAFPTDRESFLSLLSQNDPSKILVSMLTGADPDKVTAIIVLLDDLILKAKEGHNGVIDAKSDAALRLDEATQNLQAANVEVQSAEDELTAANQRKNASDIDYSDRYPNAEAELATLQEVRGKLQHLLDINTNSVDSTQQNFISVQSQTKDVSPISHLGSFNLLTILQKADPVKLRKVIAGVDELIAACEATMQELNDEATAASAAVTAAQARKATAVQAQLDAANLKNEAQAAYDTAVTNLTGKEKKELEILEQVKLLLMGLLPGGQMVQP